jgi:DNA-binding transcriptional ArsR family regulator
MEDIFLINSPQQAKAIFKPIRLEILQLLGEARTCGDLAEGFNTSPQKIYYHIKILQEAGLVKKVREERVRGIMEGYYQASAASYMLSPGMVQQLGGAEQAKQQLSLANLLNLTAQMQAEIAALSQSEEEIPTIGLSAQIALSDPADRSAFMAELQESIQSLAEKYGARQKPPPHPEEIYRLVLACYPNQPKEK